MNCITQSAPLLIAVLVFIALYNASLFVIPGSPKSNDIMGKVLFRVPALDARSFMGQGGLSQKQCCTGWQISHFILFMILGYKFPGCWLVFTVLGFLWEFVEFGLGILMKGRSTGWMGSWWGGNWTDILFNTMGLFVGIMLRRLTTTTGR